MEETIVNNLFWALMPLSYDELMEIPRTHRVRPYYIFDRIDRDNFYVFPATSKGPDELSIENDYVMCGGSQIKLDECQVLQYDTLRRFNKIERNRIKKIVKLPKSKYEELIKKMSVNYKFDEYPEKIQERVANEVSELEFGPSDILYNYNTKKYIICANVTSKGYFVFDVTYVPTAGYTEFKESGYLCYINLNNPYYLDNLDGYELKSVSSNIPSLLSLSPNADTKCDYNVNASSIADMPIGSVLTYKYDEDEYYNLIKIGEDDTMVHFLLGSIGAYKRDYVRYSFYKDEDLEYEFNHILSKPKLEYVFSKHRGII